MAKDKLTDYDSTASGNLDVGGISVAEGMLPSGVNNAIRELMSHQADAFGAGTPLYVDQTNNRLGVGNAAPATALDVTGTVTADGLTVDGTSTNSGQATFGNDVVLSNDAYIYSSNGGSGVRAGLFFDGTNQLVKGFTAGSERLRIDSSGSVGISKSAYGSISTDGFWWENGAAKYLALSGTGTSPLYLNRNGSDGGIVNFYKSGTNVGDIGVNNSDNLRIQGNSSHSGIEFGTNAIFPHKNGSNVDATIDLGESTLRWKNLYLSGGVYLGGTGSANLLDDYEEGTWTPGISAVSGSGGTTGGVGRYTKIGNQVIIAGHITPTNMGSLSGTFYVTGLPFTSRNQFIQSQGAVRSQGIGGTNHQSVSFEVLQASQNGRFHFHSSTGAQLVVQASDISVGDFVAFGLTYEV